MMPFRMHELLEMQENENREEIYRKRGRTGCVRG